MQCDEFLQGYSEYIDGRIGASRRERFASHAEACDACARYDQVIRRGLEILRESPGVSSSADFLPRLKHRLYHLEDRIPMASARHGGSAALVAVAAVGLLALSWLPFATQVPVEVELPAVSVEAPAATTPAGAPSLFEPGPFVAPSDRSRSSARASWTGDGPLDGSAWLATSPTQKAASGPAPAEGGSDPLR